jgi:hypothetical protein
VPHVLHLAEFRRYLFGLLVDVGLRRYLEELDDLALEGLRSCLRLERKVIVQNLALDLEHVGLEVEAGEL